MCQKLGSKQHQSVSLYATTVYMFCWNIAVYRCGRQDDVVLFPMETMTQVHATLLNPLTRLEKRNGVWVTGAGEEVFTIHGRIGNPKWAEGEVSSALGQAQRHLPAS